MSKQQDDEVVEPTAEFKRKKLLVGSGDGPQAVRFQLRRDVARDMGYLEYEHDAALDKLMLMKAAATRHIEVGTCRHGAVAEALGVSVEQVPALNDGYHWLLRRMRPRDKQLVMLLIAPLGDDEEILAVRKAMTQFMPEIEHACDALADEIELFNKHTKDLQEKQYSIT